MKYIVLIIGILLPGAVSNADFLNKIKYLPRAQDINIKAVSNKTLDIKINLGGDHYLGTIYNVKNQNLFFYYRFTF